jgi:hypothetical protein
LRRALLLAVLLALGLAAPATAPAAVRAGKLNASTKRQLRATKCMFRLAKRNRRIKRLYVYTWFGATTPRFDAGLVAHGRPRPAYGEVRRRLR